MYLPSDRPVSSRPRNVQQLESSRYVRDLLAATAERWLHAWCARDKQIAAAPDAALLREWFDDERRAWHAVHEVALNFRHPRTRFELIAVLRAGAARYGFARPTVPFPRYDHEPLLDRPTCETAYGEEIRGADDRLRRLAELVKNVVVDLTEWQATLRAHEADGRPLPRGALTRRCVHQTALWQLLGHWLEARDTDANDEGYVEFSARVAPGPPEGRSLARHTNGVAVG